MTLKGVVAVILRYLSEIGSFRGALRKVAEDIPKLSVARGRCIVHHSGLDGRVHVKTGLMGR